MAVAAQAARSVTSPADSARSHSSSTTTTSRPARASSAAAMVARKPVRQCSHTRPARQPRDLAPQLGQRHVPRLRQVTCGVLVLVPHVDDQVVGAFCGVLAPVGPAHRRDTRPSRGRAKDVHPAHLDADLGQVVHGHSRSARRSATRVRSVRHGATHAAYVAKVGPSSMPIEPGRWAAAYAARGRTSTTHSPRFARAATSSTSAAAGGGDHLAAASVRLRRPRWR